nr:helix-turn-helix domain-containing protein [Streptomyces sp. NBC_01177]
MLATRKQLQAEPLAGHSSHHPDRIRATWSGTASVEDAARAFGMSRSKGYDLVRRGEFPCRVLPIGRAARVVTASLLRVLESGEPEYNGAISAHQPNLTSPTRKPRRSK